MQATATYLSVVCESCYRFTGRMNIYGLNEDTTVRACSACGADLTSLIAEAIASPLRITVQVEVPEGASSRDIQDAGDEAMIDNIRAYYERHGIAFGYAEKVDEPEEGAEDATSSS